MQPRQSSWAFTKLRILNDDHHLAIFCHRDSLDCSSNRSIVEDSNNEGDNNASIHAISTNDVNSESTSSCQSESGTNEPDNSDNDRLQHQSNNHGIDTQTVQANHSDNGGNENSGGQDNTADDTMNALVVKFEEFITTKSEDALESRIHPWRHSLWKKIVCITPAQWHFDSLMDMHLNDPVRKAMHKLGLYHYLQEKIKHSARGCANRTYIRQYKDNVIKISCFSAPSGSNREDTIRRQFDIFLQEGKVIDKLYKLNPGYMGLIAPILSQIEYALLIISVSGADLLHRTLTIERNYDAFEKAWHSTAKEDSSVFKTASKYSDTVSAVVSAVLATEDGWKETGKLSSGNGRQR